MAAPTSQHGPETRRQHYSLTLGTLAVFVFAGSALQTAVTPAIPTIEQDMHIPTTTIAWVLTIPMLTAAVATPILGRLGDMYGKRRIVIFMSLATMAGCLIDALPTSIGPFLLGRGLQGLGLSTMAVCFGIVRDEFPPERRTTGYSLISGMWGVGGAAGFPFAGVIIHQLGFRWIFWIGLMLLAIGFVAVLVFVPESPVRSPARIDWGGAVVFAIGMTSLLLGISQGRSWGWDSTTIKALFATGAVVLSIWVWYELRVSAPMTDMRLLKRRGVWTVNANSVLLCVGLFGFFLIVPKIAEAPRSTGYGLGASVMTASLYLVPMSLAALAGSVSTAFIVRRAGGKAATVAGTALGLLAYILLLVGHGSVALLMIATACNGAGIGLMGAASATLLAAAVPHGQIGEANGMASMCRNLGSVIGGTIMAAILASSLLAGTNNPSEHAYDIVYVFAIAVLILGGVVAALIPNVRHAPARLHADAVEAT